MRVLWKMLAGLAAMIPLGMATAQAQSEDEIIKAFQGEWQVVDSRYATPPSPCRILLQSIKVVESKYGVVSQACRGELAMLGNWGVSEGQMALFDSAGLLIARLGGTQRRMSGTNAAGMPLILERVGVAGSASQLDAARRASGCFYAGFSANCAPDAELAKPEGDAASVQVLVNLNIRAEARDDASIVGVVPARSCVTTELCMSATDGVWCRAKFDERTGWLRKLALRQNRWPVVTFYNKCEAGG